MAEPARMACPVPCYEVPKVEARNVDNLNDDGIVPAQAEEVAPGVSPFAFYDLDSTPMPIQDEDECLVPC
jgi:hypothetical protein